MNVMQTVIGIRQRAIGILGISWVLLALTGCAGMNADFTCPMKPGHMCRSLDDVNRLVDQGNVGSNTDAISESKSSAKNSQHVQDDVTPYPIAIPNLGDPLRYGESVLRVWVAPYEDKAGNYHQPSVMYAVVHPGHWMGSPVQAITEQ